MKPNNNKMKKIDEVCMMLVVELILIGVFIRFIYGKPFLNYSKVDWFIVAFLCIVFIVLRIISSQHYGRNKKSFVDELKYQRGVPGIRATLRIFYLKTVIFFA